MPKFDVEGIGEIEIPDGASREDVYEILKRRLAPQQTTQAPPPQPQQAPLSALGHLGALFAGIGRGVTSLPVTMLEGVGGVTGSETLKDTARGMRQSDLGKLLWETPDNYKDRYASTTGEIAGNLMTMLAPGAAANAARLPSWAARGASVLTGMGQGAAEQVQRAEENRRAGQQVTPEQETSAARKGSLTGLLEILPTERLLPGSSAAGYNLVRQAAEAGLGGVAKRALGTGMVEGATEVLQQLGQNTIEQQYNPNQQWNEGVMESGGAGVAAGSILDLLIKGRGTGVARQIAERRTRLDSAPIEALPDVDSVGVRADQQGAPIIEMLRRMQEAPPAPTYVGPKESYQKPAVEEPALTPKEREALRIQQYQERMQRLIPDAPPAPIEAGPVEKYKTTAQQSPAEVTVPETTPLLDEVITATEERQAPSVASEVAKTTATLTDEGTVVTPSNLAMDQPGAPKFSVDEPAPVEPAPIATTPYTVESLGKEIEAGVKPEIALDVFNEMKRLGVDDLLSTRLIDTISNPAGGTSQGTYSNRIVQLALNGKSKPDLLRTLNHESVHAMQQMGLFTPEEWQILTTSFNPNTSLSDYEKDQYAKLYKGDPTRIQEEAVARGIEKYALGQIEAPDAAISVASKALGTIDRLGNVLRGRGFKNADDVMQAFRTGDIGSRPAMLPPEAPAPRTMTDYERQQYATKPNGKANQQVVQPAQNQQPRVAANTGRKTDIAGFLAEGVEDQEVAPTQPTVSASVAPNTDPVKPNKNNYQLPPLPEKLPYAKPDDRWVVKKALDEFVDPAPLGGFGLRARQELIDRRAAIEKASKLASKKRGEEWDIARTSSEAAVRNFDASMDLASAGLESGAPEYIGQRGDGYFKVRDDKRNAPLTVFGEAKDAGKLDHLFLYLMGERSDVLSKQNRELKITPQEIAQWKSYGNDSQIKDWAGRWRKFNDDMIDLWQKSGRISADDAKYYKENFYLPYYRVEKDGKVNFQGSGASLATSPEIQKLKGSLKDLGDPIDNIVRNVNMITASAMKNEADVRIARDMMDLGIGRQVIKRKIDGKDRYVPANGAGEVDTNRLMHAWVDGKEKHFEVLDPILYDSIASNSFAPKGAMKVAFELARVPSKMLRTFVTGDPVFMVNNTLMRDPTYVWLSGYSDFPLQRVFQDSFRSIAERPRFKDLERTGVVGNTIRGEGGATGTGRNLRQKIDSKPHPLKKYTEFSRKSEAINRMTVYDKVMERTGGDEAQAQYEARELLNFGRHGNAAWVQAMNSLIPFQNAAWQGADVLYRGLKGSGVNKDIQKTLATRMVGLGALSALYTLLASQYDDWKTATAEERDLNYFGPNGFKFKIPFEAGYIAKVFPERLTAMYLGHDDGKEFIGAFRRFIESTMKVDIIPQIIKPAMEVMNNRDTFRNRSIEPEYMQRYEKTQRSDDRTSELAKKISEFTEVLSPLQVDHLLRGYLGGIGQYMVQLGSLLTDPSTAAEKASLVGRAPNEYPVLGKFFQPEQGAGPIVEYYRDADKGEQAKNALEQGLPATEERVGWAQYDEAMKPVDEQIKLLSDRLKMVRKAMDNGDLPAEEGRAIIREYVKSRNELAGIANKAAKTLR